MIIHLIKKILGDKQIEKKVQRNIKKSLEFQELDVDWKNGNWRKKRKWEKSYLRKTNCFIFENTAFLLY